MIWRSRRWVTRSKRVGTSSCAHKWESIYPAPGPNTLSFLFSYSILIFHPHSISPCVFLNFSSLFEQKHRHHRTWRQWRVKSTVISVSLTSQNLSHQREKIHSNRNQYSLPPSSLEISLIHWTGMMVFTDLSYNDSKSGSCSNYLF